MSNDQFTGQHAVRGATKEKSKKLDELKARRKAKDEKKRVSMDNAKANLVSQWLLESHGLSQTGPFIITYGHGYLIW